MLPDETSGLEISLWPAFFFPLSNAAVMSPGDVFYLRREAGEPRTKGPRPHLLLHPRTPRQDDPLTLAFGSTKNTDAQYGAEHVLVDPLASTRPGTGLSRPTYVYTSRLVSAGVGELGPVRGRIVDEMPAIRQSLVRALGLGTGVTREMNAWGSNRRGRLVETTRAVVEEWGIDHALVVTEPHYSREGYQQTVVPLLDDSFEASELDVVLDDRAWLGFLAERYGAGSLAVPMVSTLFLPDHIARFLNIVAPAEVMSEVERGLVAHLRLFDRV